jgi:beta-carotene 3-hydroxylase
MLINILILLITFIAMEGVTWFTHKYIMHGFLWILHEDHHDHRKRIHPVFEKNDLFFLMFAFPSMGMIYIGLNNVEYSYLLFIGVGVAMYGLAYFLVHEVIIHERFKYFSNIDNVYLRALRKAHKVHHKHLGKEDGECFGMLLVPKKFFIEAYRSKQKK